MHIPHGKNVLDSLASVRGNAHAQIQTGKGEVDQLDNSSDTISGNPPNDGTYEEFLDFKKMDDDKTREEHYSDSVFRNRHGDSTALLTLDSISQNPRSQKTHRTEINEPLLKQLEFKIKVYENEKLLNSYAESASIDDNCKDECIDDLIRKAIMNNGICPNAKKIMGNKWKCPDGRIIRVSMTR